MNTVRDHRAALVARFAAAGVPDPACDADWLLAHIIGGTRSAVLLHGDRELSASELMQFTALADRRCTREPLQYLIGTQEFYGRSFVVTPDVLIPRPETEQLVALALEHIPQDIDATWLEIGAGSGCIAVTLLTERPRLRMIATDISPAALAIAHRNAEQHHVADRLQCIGPVDCWPAVPQRFAGIVSNPPYLTDAEAHAAQPELAYEPQTALTAGDDGLAVIRCIITHAADWLAPGGVLCLEVGATQTAAVAALARTAGLTSIAEHIDWQGRPRFVVAHARI